MQNDDDMARFSSILSTVAKAERDTLARKRILESLRFSSMKERLERIPEAYEETFDWVYHEENDQSFPSSSNVDHASGELDQLSDNVLDSPRTTQRQEENRRPWSNFVQWLRGEETLYWITGKPGSGKSTLMKYLFNDPRTSEHLQLWSQDCRVIKAGFFFWNSGTAMQMSEMGLLRTLLYQAIEKNSAHVATLFPDRWRYYELFGGDYQSWSRSELVAAFSTLTKSEENKFLFFIDGLDEFDGNDTELASFVLEIASRRNVKICVASRPWLAFEDAFQRRPSLRLEDLTAVDIQRFVAGTLAENRMFSELQRLFPEDAKSLVIEVTGKACGVFLWVRLVVVSLLEGLRDGDSVADLKERLLEIPTDLEALFWRILHCLGRTYLGHASRLFQLIHAATEPLSLLTLSFAEDDYKTCMEAKVKPMSIGGRDFRAETMRRRLNSRCKGLIEAPTFELEGAEARVQYLHRTVRDFLAKEDVWDYIVSSTRDPYDPDFKLCGAFLLQVKTLEPRKSELALDHFWASFKSCIDYSCHLEHRRHDVYVDVIDELGAASQELFNARSPSGETWFDNLLEDSRSSGLFVMQRIPHWTATGDFGGELGFTSFLDYALAYPLYSYVEHKIQNGHEFDPSNLDALLDKGRRKDPRGMARLQDMLKGSTLMPPAPKASRSRFQVHNFMKKFSGRGS